MSLWRTFNQAEKQAIWAEYRDQPELCPEPAPVVEVKPEVVEPLQPISGPQAESLRRFDELVAQIQFTPPPMIRSELPQVKAKVVSGYEYPTPMPKPQPAPKVKEPGHITTVGELPLKTQIMALVNILGWILVVWFFIWAFGPD
jgi:hypothetical protein